VARSEFRVRMNGPVSIVEVRGPLDEEAATHLLEFAAAAATACPSVEIELDGVESMTQEAAAVLRFRDAPGRAEPENSTLRSSGGRPGRQAVLHAYARWRARNQTA
jgi:hypothetical protein